MCGSSRRRPITSPPGGGTLARPRRASSGPGEQERGADAARRARRRARAWRRRRRGRGPRSAPVHSTSAPSAASSAHIVSTSRMRGTLCSTTGSLVEQARGEDRQRAVLVPGGADAAAAGAARPRSRRTLRARSVTAVWAIGGGYPSAPWSHPRAGLGDADPLHEERGAAPPRARRRGRRRAPTRSASARTRSSGARPRCSTTSTTRCTRRSTSTRRTARRSCARRAIPRR